MEKKDEYAFDEFLKNEKVIYHGAGAFQSARLGFDAGYQHAASKIKNVVAEKIVGERPIIEVLGEVYGERCRQDAKWGEQNHCPKTCLMILGEEVGEANKAVLEAGVYENGKFTLPEPLNHLLSKTKGSYREKLIQVAAVAIAAVECLDREKWRS